MQSCTRSLFSASLLLLALASVFVGGDATFVKQIQEDEISDEVEDAHHHHHGHHHRHHKHSSNKSSALANASSTVKILSKMKTLENQLAVTEAAAAASAATNASEDADDSDAGPEASAAKAHGQKPVYGSATPVALAADVPPAPVAAEVSVNLASTPCPPGADSDIDIDTEMPYGELEPFGREDTAQELTESSITESDQMVDQLERAEVAEEKRAVFRALTRLRGAAITSFDGVARSQTGNIDEYNKVHKWRNTHPLRHLADEESDIAKWAFPETADF